MIRITQVISLDFDITPVIVIDKFNTPIPCGTAASPHSNVSLAQEKRNSLFSNGINQKRSYHMSTKKRWFSYTSFRRQYIERFVVNSTPNNIIFNDGMSILYLSPFISTNNKADALAPSSAQEIFSELTLQLSRIRNDMSQFMLNFEYESKICCRAGICRK